MTLFWALMVVVLILLIPLLAIVIDSQIGQALARRIARESPPGELEARVDAMEGDAELTREAVDAALGRLFSGERRECTVDELLEELSDMASTVEVTVEFDCDALELIVERLQEEEVIALHGDVISLKRDHA